MQVRAGCNCLCCVRMVRIPATSRYVLVPFTDILHDRVFFTATTVMATMHVMRTRNGSRGKRNPQMEVHT